MNARAALMLGALVLVGCGGGGGHASAPSVPGSSLSTGTQSGTMSLTFAAPVTTSAAARKPQFVSPNATTAILDINNGTPMTFNVATGSTLCQTVNNVRTCTLPVTAPTGQTAFGVSLMGTVNGSAVLLGQGGNSVTVVSGTVFNLTVGINPIVATVNQTTTACCYTFGMANSQSSQITFADASGAAITGSGNVPNFLAPVTLVSSDPHFTTTPTQLLTPGQGFTVNYDGSPAVAQTVTVTAMVGALTLTTETFQMPGLFITRFNLGAIGTINPQQIASGPDGNVWVALQATNDIARVTPAGVVSMFPTGFIAGHGPMGVTVGGDGLIYYTDNNSCSIGRMDANGVQQGGLAAAAGGGCNLWQMGTDGSGNVWYVDTSHNEVGYMVPASWPSPGTFCGVLPTAFSFSINQTITLGHDGAMWFTEGGNGHKIGRYASTATCNPGGLTEYTPPSAGNHDLGGLALGADNNLWFTEQSPNIYGKITPAGAITELPNSIGGPVWIASASADGDLYVPQGGGAATFNPATPATSVTQMFVDANGKEGQTNMRSAINGPDGNVWFSGDGSAGGGGFIATQDEVAKFVPR